MAKSGLRCSLWRVSFSAGESRLLTSLKDNDRFCCIDVMKLIKNNLKNFKSSSTNSIGHLHIGSFHLKMLFLKCFDDKPEDNFWSKKNLRLCYAWTLGQVIRYMKDEYLPHYFVRYINVLDKVVWKTKYTECIQYLNSQKDFYSTGLTV